jgi:hypothetical protein
MGAIPWFQKCKTHQEINAWGTRVSDWTRATVFFFGGALLSGTTLSTARDNQSRILLAIHYCNTSTTLPLTSPSLCDHFFIRSAFILPCSL